MSRRVNRNGIPILDPPHEDNRLRPARCATPDDHEWGPPIRTDQHYDYVFDEGSDQFTQTCRRCGLRDSYWRAWPRCRR